MHDRRPFFSRLNNAPLGSAPQASAPLGSAPLGFLESRSHESASSEAPTQLSFIPKWLSHWESHTATAELHMVPSEPLTRSSWEPFKVISVTHQWGRKKTSPGEIA